tara:strand:+ start:305 stop:502 length:198 start_codon:yes stop_codon:yes gene_type:complete
VTASIHIDVQLLVFNLVEKFVSPIKVIIVFRTGITVENMLCDLVSDLTKLKQEVTWHEIKETVVV